MHREHWRKVLKFRAIAQTIAAIVSAIAAIHQLLKRQLTCEGALLQAAFPCLFLLWHKSPKK